MKFTFRQLAYFIAAAETGSITLASKRANISQPAISTAISHIERELDVQLFLRHHAQGLSLTPAGRALLRDAKQLLKQADGLYSAAADISHQMRATKCAASCRWAGFPRLRPSSCPSWCMPF
jgi:DNA-binding transcriptional LysR family regulator